MKEYGKLVGKVLVLLAQGTMLGLSRDKGLRLEILKDADRTWHEIDRKLLYQILKRLKLGHHIEFLKTRNGIEILNAPTHQELSNMVGASREAITRIIKILKENRNLVSYKGRRLILREYSVKSLL